VQYQHADFDEALGGGAEEESTNAPANAPAVNQGPKVGRNDPCPCGSGKKYKHCHGKLS
jgi:preprotein translocase subunit SecA